MIGIFKVRLINMQICSYAVSSEPSNVLFFTSGDLHLILVTLVSARGTEWQSYLYLSAHDGDDIVSTINLVMVLWTYSCLIEEQSTGISSWKFCIVFSIVTAAFTAIALTFKWVPIYKITAIISSLYNCFWTLMRFNFWYCYSITK